MNFLDILIIAGITVGFFIGWKLRAISLLGIVVSLLAGIWVANHFHPQLIALYRDLPPAVGRILAWLTVFIATAVIISILVGLVSKMFEIINLQWLDRLLGAMLTVTVVLGLSVVSLTVVDHLAKTYRWLIIEHSTLAPLLLKVSRPLIQQGVEKIPGLQRNVR